MQLSDLIKVKYLDYTIALKHLRKDPKLEYSVMSGHGAIAVVFKGKVRGYVASRKFLKLWNVTAEKLPYGHLFLSHYGTIWENIDGKILEFGENFPIAIAADLLKEKEDNEVSSG